MKSALLRVGSLGVVMVLGWIAIANAQRGEPSSDPSSTTSASQDANPLRAVPSRSIPPAADPFGLRKVPASSVTATSAEQPASGPSLGEPDQPAHTSDGGYSARPDRMASRVGPRYADPIPPAKTLAKTSTNSEPAPLRIDPFAMPANPMRNSKPDRTPIAKDSFGRSDEPPLESEGAGLPGDQQLEGAQNPQLSIQKIAPKEIQVGKPAVFRIVVRNVGQIAAGAVEVRDMTPKGTKLQNTTPQANRNAKGEIVWTVGTLRPGEQWTGTMQLMPTAEGRIGSVATVHFGADASASSMATRPQLVVETTGPDSVLIGEQAKLVITVSNPGSGVAAGVVLDERIPPGLQHPAGDELEYEVGDLKPGETRKLELPLAARRPGRSTNWLTARGDGSLRAESRLDIEVLAPQLDVAVDGPRRRYLERQATYTLSVKNPGTAPAKQVELAAELPAGLKFVSANNAGYYEESTRTVHWRLEELPAREIGSVTMVTLPVEAGQHAIRLRGSAQKGLVAEKQQPVLVEGVAAVLFQVADTADPIGLGEETTYEVRVVNQGSKAASNVRLTALLPPELKATAVEGPTRYSAESDRITFDGLAQLAPKDEAVFHIRAKALRAGDLRARFQLLTDDLQTPVNKEESTRVYADE
ncbi:MAG: hypothetical protein ABFC77_14055 [Thermoguttaceae bacterium]